MNSLKGVTYHKRAGEKFGASVFSFAGNQCHGGGCTEGAGLELHIWSLCSMICIMFYGLQVFDRNI